ncbi:MAG TPA: hypothetical protein VH300_04985 [Thermoleophilaceae bacterium]|nr:hypothetical protein [Thermoleophilaceae bacterium]
MSLTMYDSVTVGEIPGDATFVAGYVNGNFVTFPTLEQRFPSASRMSIAVSSSADADCLDVELGDAPNSVAPAWVKRQMQRGVKQPVIYTQLSNAQSLLNVLAGAGVKRSDIRLWTAHYTDTPHRCSPACGFSFTTTADATQWTKHSLGRNLDESLCDDSFFSVHEIRFTRNERKTIGLIQKLRSRPATPARRAAIEACRATLLVYRAKLRAAAKLSGGWDVADRRARYHAILAVYKGQAIDL